MSERGSKGSGRGPEQASDSVAPEEPDAVSDSPATGPGTTADIPDRGVSPERTGETPGRLDATTPEAGKASGQPAVPTEDGGKAPELPGGSTEEAEKAPEWWEDERMPWKGRPTRADLGCWAAITAIGIFALIMLPLRPVLLGYTPYVLVALTGSRTGMVTIGALGATGDPWWPLGLVIGILSIVKFDLVYFWAGKLWGRGLLGVFAGRSPRARRNAERAERAALKYASPAVALTYLPIPIPAAVIYATVAMAGMSWRKFIIVNLICATVVQTGWLALGWALGEPAVRVVDIYADYSMYLSFAILAGMIVAWIWKSNKDKAGRSEDVDA